MHNLSSQFLTSMHPALPRMRQSFTQVAQPPWNYGFRVIKDLARMLLGAFSSANRGYLSFVGNDLRNGELNRTCHLRHG